MSTPTAAAVPYYDRTLSATAADDYLSRIHAQKRGKHEGGVAHKLPSDGWAWVVPTKKTGEVRLRVYAGRCPC